MINATNVCTVCLNYRSLSRPVTRFFSGAGGWKVRVNGHFVRKRSDKRGGGGKSLVGESPPPRAGKILHSEPEKNPVFSCIFWTDTTVTLFPPNAKLKGKITSFFTERTFDRQRGRGESFELPPPGYGPVEYDSCMSSFRNFSSLKR